MAELFPVLSGGRYGYIDRLGRLQLDFEYDFASDEVDGVALLNAGGQWAFIDLKRNEMVEVQEHIGRCVDAANSGFEGCWRFKALNGLWGVVGTNGRVLIEPKFLYISGFSEAVAVASAPQQPRLFGYVNTSGEWVLPPKYTACAEFRDGLAFARIGKSGGFINIHGEFVTDQIYTRAGSFYNGIAMVEFGADFCNLQPNARVGYVSRAGTTVIPPSFTVGRDFRSAKTAAAIQEGGYYIFDDEPCVALRWGFVDCSGQMNQTNYTFIGEYSEGVCPVASGGHTTVAEYQLQGRWGYVDSFGLEMIPCSYSRAEPFRGGLARVSMSQVLLTHKWLAGTRYVDQSNNPVWINDA